MRDGLGADPEGKRRMEACLWTDLPANPGPILAWAVMRWSVEVTCEEARAHVWLETQRQGSNRAIARTALVLLALFPLVTLPALRLSEGGAVPVETTAWDHTPEPTLVDCLA